MDGVTSRDRLLAALVAVIWGFNFVVIEWGMDGVPPLLFLALRFVAVLVPAIFLVARPDLPWRVILAIGAFMSLGQFGFLYTSMHAGMPPGLAALVLQAQVILTIVIAAGALREVPTPVQVTGVLIGSVGLVVVGVGRGGSVTLTALALCLLGALSWAVGNVIARAAGGAGGLGVTVWSALVVPLPLVLLSLLLDGPGAVVAGLGAFGWEAVLSTAYTAGLSSLVGYGIFTVLLGRNAAAEVVPWILLVPPVAMVSAWALLGDVPTTAEVVGGALLLGGVLLATRLGVRRAAVERCERGADPAGGEVGGALGDLLGRAPGDRADLPLLEAHIVEGRDRQHSAVEDETDGVVPAAPGR